VLEIFSASFVEHKHLATAVSRLKRVTTILRLLVSQIDVLETMTPLQFLEFRDYLFPASGFQSVQFRVLEAKLGLKSESRIQYAGSNFCSFLKEHDAQIVQELDGEKSLFDLVEAWLERTPLLDGEHGTSFWKAYRKTVEGMFDHERDLVKERKLAKAEQDELLGKIDSRAEHLSSLFDSDRYREKQLKGESRLSHKALQAALLITTYQDEPLMHYPSQMLLTILDIDELLTTWRYRHSQMVHRMLGDKVGTGGSSGYRYLQAAASRHRVFTDLFNLSTYLIRPQCLPPIEDELKRLLSFTFEKELKPKA